MTTTACTRPISFVVLGKPATAGNKRPITFRRKDGSIGARVIEGRDRAAGEHARTWRSDVRDAARANYDGMPLEGPISLELTFIVPRPAGHFRKNGELSAAGLATPYPTTRPDSTKRLRAFEDALSGVVWKDDSQIVLHVVRKVYGVRFETRATIAELASAEALQ